ncbi:unnamed protein product [Acanthoscelides obtectus]|uniref:N-acetylglucosamine-1-phosphotransferase subunits alpha/beta n=1 Tax=Acanthoscelides obtectus TaxID=200917 RepID=A0A9P0KEB1_ACAOB|nr:unnamed protein product [Acanthoscelides obtectus]CAK1677230.1 N-acetylglucosamine-1-phosphotransferase subunits alpha/beta [Acanthoscelides obtectus]
MVFVFRLRRRLLKYKVSLVISFIIISLLFCFRVQIAHRPSEYCYNEEPIDVVYTWVNGSDPEFLESLNAFTSGIRDNVDYSKQRFDDKYELKFSLRSLEKYAPWVRHVYVVTNGQIPYWLDLDYDKVTIVSHKEIFQDPSSLPTFSSPAIERNLHRIPNLSKKFIYFNDDIFLAAPTFKEDFYTPNKGYLVYLAWLVPNCSPNCPWMYVADGQCDKDCFLQQCQMDGGDCDGKDIPSQLPYMADQSSVGEMKEQKQSQLNMIKQIKTNFYKLNHTTTYHGVQNISTSNFLNIFVSESTTQIPVYKPFKKWSLENLTKIVEIHNKLVLRKDRLRRKRLRKQKDAKNHRWHFQGNTQVDAYSASLQHTNRMLNVKYGFRTRKVPSHAPIMIDRQIMTKLQDTFNDEFEITEKNRVRRGDDVQFSFAYYYYLMSEQIDVPIGEIFEEFDTDKSGTWSDREIRTLLTKLYELPLSYSIVDHFEAILLNCSENKVFSDVSTPEYERYIDSKLPTISERLVASCPTLVKLLNDRFGLAHKYHFEIISDAESKHVSFKMLNSNISDVVVSLDEIRSNSRKFVCLNDNLDESKVAENELVRAILYDFYLALFPQPSKFELPDEYRNKFVYIKDLNEWKMYRFKIKLFIVFLMSTVLWMTLFNVIRRRFCQMIDILFC